MCLFANIERAENGQFKDDAKNNVYHYTHTHFNQDTTFPIISYAPMW